MPKLKNYDDTPWIWSLALDWCGINWVLKVTDMWKP